MNSNDRSHNRPDRSRRLAGTAVTGDADGSAGHGRDPAKSAAATAADIRTTRACAPHTSGGFSGVDHGEDARAATPMSGGASGTADGEVSLATSSAELASAVDLLRDSDRSIARAVVLLGRVARSGVCEAVERMPLDLFLTNLCRLIGSDRHMLLVAADVLTHMPALARLFQAGEVSWGQVRNITKTCQRLSREHRAHVDGRIEATFERWEGLDGLHPEELIHEVDRAVALLEGPEQAERDERDAPASNFVAVQPRFDGGMRFHGEADPLSTPVILGGWDAAARDRRKAGGAAMSTDDGEFDTEDDQGGSPNRPDRAFRRFQGLLGCAEAYLAGGNGRRPRPSMHVIVDVRDLQPDSAGKLLTRLPGCLPNLTARLVDGLATDAEVRAVVMDGARPLATTSNLTADDIPTAVRRAVIARDRGDRFPGSLAPASEVDVHHIRHREHGGDHDPDGLIALSRLAHRHLIHDRAWRVALDPATGQAWFTNGHRTFRSLPRATPLEHHPEPRGQDPPAHGSGNDPPNPVWN